MGNQEDLRADLESVKLPGVKETAEEASAPGDLSMSKGTEEGLVKEYVGPLPFSAARPGASPAMAVIRLLSLTP